MAVEGEIPFDWSCLKLPKTLVYYSFNAKNFKINSEGKKWVRWIEFLGGSSRSGLMVISKSFTDVVEEENSDLPSSYSLLQNYPNPFNPVTVISYELKRPSQVELKIYNLTGQLIKTLVAEKQLPGKYSVEWNAANQSSGIYFYRMETESFSKTMKMLLVK